MQVYTSQHNCAWLYAGCVRLRYVKLSDSVWHQFSRCIRYHDILSVHACILFCSSIDRIRFQSHCIRDSRQKEAIKHIRMSLLRRAHDIQKCKMAPVDSKFTSYDGYTRPPGHLNFFSNFVDRLTTIAFFGFFFSCLLNRSLTVHSIAIETYFSSVNSVELIDA